jgi:hypothetical protein
MTRAELLEAAATKLTQVVSLLAATGEQRLAFEAEALAEQVEFRFKGRDPSTAEVVLKVPKRKVL